MASIFRGNDLLWDCAPNPHVAFFYWVWRLLCHNLMSTGYSQWSHSRMGDATPKNRYWQPWPCVLKLHTSVVDNPIKGQIRVNVYVKTDSDNSEFFLVEPHPYCTPKKIHATGLSHKRNTLFWMCKKKSLAHWKDKLLTIFLSISCICMLKFVF